MQVKLSDTEIHDAYCSVHGMNITDRMHNIMIVNDGHRAIVQQAQQRWQAEMDKELEVFFLWLIARGLFEEATKLKELGQRLRQALGMEGQLFGTKPIEPAARVCNESGTEGTATGGNWPRYVNPEGSPLYLDTDGQWKLKPENRLLTQEEYQKLPKHASMTGVIGNKSLEPSSSDWKVYASDIAKAQDTKTRLKIMEWLEENNIAYKIGLTIASDKWRAFKDSTIKRIPCE